MFCRDQHTPDLESNNLFSFVFIELYFRIMRMITELPNIDAANSKACVVAISPVTSCINLLPAQHQTHSL